MHSPTYKNIANRYVVIHLQQAASAKFKPINIMNGLANESLTSMLNQSFN